MAHPRGSVDGLRSLMRIRPAPIKVPEIDAGERRTTYLRQLAPSGISGKVTVSQKRRARQEYDEFVIIMAV